MTVFSMSVKDSRNKQTKQFKPLIKNVQYGFQHPKSFFRWCYFLWLLLRLWHGYAAATEPRINVSECSGSCKCLQTLRLEIAVTILLLQACSHISYWQLYSVYAFRNSALSNLVLENMQLLERRRFLRCLFIPTGLFALLHTYCLSVMSCSLWFHTLQILGIEFPS